MLNNFYIGWLLLTAAIVLVLFTKKRAARTYHAHLPLLLSHYTEKSQPFYIGGGKINNSAYTISTTLDKGAVLVHIELPFQTTYHILSLSEAIGSTKPQVPDFLEKIELEGDYGSYFSLYAPASQHSVARYLLDPKAMKFTINYCRSHSWEILDRQLYVLQQTDSDSSDNTTLEQDIAGLIKELRPKISEKIPDSVIESRTILENEKRTSLPCPICASVMVKRKGYFECENGDGILINAKTLQTIKTNPLLEKSWVEKTNSSVQLTCPSCGFELQKTNLSGNATIQIDSCLHCSYRWLDGVELSAMKKRLNIL